MSLRLVPLRADFFDSRREVPCVGSVFLDISLLPAGWGSLATSVCAEPHATSMDRRSWGWTLQTGEPAGKGPKNLRSTAPENIVNRIDLIVSKAAIRQLVRKTNHERSARPWEAF